MKIKVLIYDDEYYPFYYIRAADKDDGRGIYEINEELFKRYIDMRDKLKKIEEEIDAIVRK